MSVRIIKRKNNETKLTTMEKERPDALEMAEKED